MAYDRRRRLPSGKVRLILFLALAAGGLLFFCRAAAPRGPLLEKLPFSTAVSDRSDRLLRLTLASDEKYRLKTPLENFPPVLTEAVLLKEDRHFYLHPGVNPVALVRAFFTTYLGSGRRVGASTISMQLARLLYGLETRSIPGKFIQIFRAFSLELAYSKREILEAYLNLAPCGGNIEGFPAAALIYFGKPVERLNLPEALTLAVLPQDPSARRPGAAGFSEELKPARERLFELWCSVHPEAESERVHLELPLDMEPRLPFLAPHYVNAVLEKFPDRREIRGTLDLGYQEIFERLLGRYVDRKRTLGVNNAAALFVDTDTMEILASVGSADFFDDAIQGQVDGTRARRSPGSTLKPFIYALSLQQGLIHPMTMLVDAPTSFSEYAPDNYQSDFKGPVKAWEALVESRNVPAVALASKIHDPDLYDFLKNADVGNLKPKEHYGLSIVLGSAELSMEELVTLYGALANGGTVRQLSRVIEEPPLSVREKPVHSTTEERRPLTREAAFLTREMLKLNPRPGASGLESAADEREAVAYKTGTSIGFKDAWSVGIFDHYIVAVWFGNFDGYGNPAFNGRYLATPLLFELVDTIRPGCSSDPRDELPPEGVIRTEVCAVSGKIAREACRTKILTWYIPGISPIESCDICREITIDSASGCRTLRKTGDGLEKRIYEFWPTNLLSLFRQAGIPRVTPPPFGPDEDLSVLALSGTPPVIVSPVAAGEYILRAGNSEFGSLPLSATADADVRELYWFINETFTGRSAPDTTAYWPLVPGSFNVSVVDDHGRSCSRTITVTSAR